MDIDINKLSKENLKKLGRIPPHNVMVVEVNIKR